MQNILSINTLINSLHTGNYLPLVFSVLFSIIILLTLIRFKHSQYIYENNTKLPSTTEGVLKSVIPNIIYTIIIVFVFSLIVGFKPFIVLSGSMRPSIQPGDLIIAKSIPLEELKIGDTITFGKNIRTTHQIIAIKNDGTFYEIGEEVHYVLDGEERVYTISTAGNQIITRGTANNTIDSPLPYSAVEGRVFYIIPLVGYVFNIWVQKQYLSLIISVIAIYLGYKGFMKTPEFEF